MDSSLRLLKNQNKETEKRIFPRYPFSYLTFRPNKNEISKNHVFEVRDIGLKGMQLALKDGGHSYDRKHKVLGKLHWFGKECEIRGVVRWATDYKLGVEFDNKSEKSIQKFLSVKNIISSVRPLHKTELDLSLPANLKYWIKADGPLESFIWTHGDGEIAKFQFVVLSQFLEWVDGEGIKTGDLISKDYLDQPLNPEEEILFEVDSSIDQGLVLMIKEIIQSVRPETLPDEVRKFILRKL